MAVVESLNIGAIKNYGKFSSAMHKSAIDSGFCDFNGIKGDKLSDTIHHGGKYKALFANAVSNYLVFSKFASKKLELGQMGENLSVSGLDENSVCIGDIHCVGSTLLRVSEPRKPCAKLSKIIAEGMTKFIFENGLSGWYYEVLEPGQINCKDIIEVVKADENQLSVMELNMLFFAPKQNLHLIPKLQNLNIRDEWKESINARIKGIYDNSYMYQL
ncbi:MOSC domain-containing protein [Campylobacter vicugnae]|uniref:MOSC domain-containing protein n=1 Tax=Campylobacter vicugnae TaxID=1660076 RepID=UPI000A35533A|nr:MOSC domain-containing protein [Campylobacter sp. S0112]